MPIDYETLRVIWWLLIGVLLGGFAVFDGFDLGAAMLLPFVGRNDMERRIIINSVGPVWEGNQVWLVVGAAAIFAAWPMVYAVAFSGFYLAMYLALAGLILRPVSLKFRSKVNHPTWRKVWDNVIFISGFLPTFIFGVAIGNVLQGFPFHFNAELRVFYSGTFIDLLNPLALSCGLLSVAMFVMHGGLYLGIKTEDAVKQRAISAARVAAIIVVILFALVGLWVTYELNGYLLSKAIAHDGPSNPLYKSVITVTGGWIYNFGNYPWMMIAPFLGFVGAISVRLFTHIGKTTYAFLASSVSLLGIIATVGLSMFPFILPSSSDPQASLLVWDASSSHLTLFIMFVVTVFFMPIILLYTAWVYKMLRGTVNANTIEENKDNAY